MKKINIEVRMWIAKDDTSVMFPWNAYDVGVPGLAVCRRPCLGNGDAQPHPVKGWSITHIQSGMSLVDNLKSKGQAEEVAIGCADLADWTLAEEELSQIEGLDKAVRDIYWRVKE